MGSSGCASAAATRDASTNANIGRLTRKEGEERGLFTSSLCAHVPRLPRSCLQTPMATQSPPKKPRVVHEGRAAVQPPVWRHLTHFFFSRRGRSRRHGQSTARHYGSRSRRSDRQVRAPAQHGLPCRAQAHAAVRHPFVFLCCIFVYRLRPVLMILSSISSFACIIVSAYVEHC